MTVKALIIRCVGVLLLASSVFGLGFGQIYLHPQVLLNKGIINIRDIRIIEKDALTGVYNGCMVDCTNNPIFYSFTWNTTDVVLTKKVLFEAKDSLFSMRWITGINSCEFAGNDIFKSYLGEFDTNTTFTNSINLEKLFPLDSYSVYINNQVVTLLLDKSATSYEGDMVRRLVNGTEIAYYYDSSLDTVPSGIMQFYVHQSQPTEFYMARVITTPESTLTPEYEFGLDTSTVIVDKCTSALDCNMHLTETNTIASTFVSDSQRWYFCGRAVVLNNTNAIAGDFYCISSADPNTRVPVSVPSYYGSSYNLALIAYERTISVLLSDGTLVLGVLDQLSNRYNLFALDPANNFNILATKQSTRNGDMLSMMTYDGYIIVSTDSSIDFWALGNYSDAVTGTPEATAVPVSTSTPSNPPVNSNVVNPPVVEEIDALGISLGVCLSVAGAVGIFLIIYFFVIKKKMDKKKNDKKESSTGDGSDPDKYSLMPAKNETETISEKMQIPYKQLKFLGEIGAGSFGKVYRGKWKGAEVAIKMSTLFMEKETFLKEAKLTVDLPPHPNVVRTFGVSIDSEFPYIVLEFCDGGSLDKILSKQQLNVDEQKALVKGIAFGLLHLHSHNIVHRDLAARNILLGNGKPKISDFGMSRVLKDMSQQGQTETSIGPIRWMAPESLQDLKYSVKSDVWTFGIVVSEIVNGHEPHFGEDQLDVAAKIRDEAYAPTIPADCDPTLQEIMEKCWKAKPEDRPTMFDLCQLISNNF